MITNTSDLFTHLDFQHLDRINTTTYQITIMLYGKPSCTGQRSLDIVIGEAMRALGITAITDETPFNDVAGEGQHSHEIPTEIGQTVHMRDGAHKGTMITRLDDERWVFVCLEDESVEYCERVILFELSPDALAHSTPDIAGMDLDSPNGLMLLGIDLLDLDVDGRPLDIPDYGTVLWDSSTVLEENR